MRFEERESKPYAEPVLPDQSQEGKVYFADIFLDERGLVPSVEPRVCVGAKTEPEGTAERYIFEYERALDVLMAYALRRRKETDGI